MPIRIRPMHVGPATMPLLALRALVAAAAVWAIAPRRSHAETPSKPKAEAARQDEHPLLPALAHARQGLDAITALDDYRAKFTKREFVNGALTAQTMHIKVRHRPFSVYLQYVDPYPGREVLYVDGRYRNKLLAHEGGVTGFIGTVRLKPTHPRAMEGNRYPITRIGMAEMLRSVVAQWERESKFAPPAGRDRAPTVRYFPEAKIDGTPCRAIECTQPAKRDGVTFHRTRVFLDRKTKLPIRVQQFAFPEKEGDAPPLVEEYTYGGIQVNVGLTDLDFDRRNPAYGF